MGKEIPASLLDRIPPYQVVDGFLGDVLIDRLLSFAMDHESDFVPSDVGYGHSNFTAPEVRVSSMLRDLGSMRAELAYRFKGIMQEAVSRLKLSPFDLARLEIEMVAHQDGAFFQRHIDTQTGIPDAETQRVLTAVLYLHALPKGFDGGQFRLFSLSGKNFIDIEPLRDRLVLFPSWVPHEVLPVSCPSKIFEQSRFAINCWYRRRTPDNQNEA